MPIGNYEDNEKRLKKAAVSEAQLQLIRAQIGCDSCFNSGFTVCECSKANPNTAKSLNNDASPKVVTEGNQLYTNTVNSGVKLLFSPNGQFAGQVAEDEDDNVRRYKLMNNTSLEDMKAFFDKHIEKLAEENLCVSPEDIEQFKKEKGYTATIVGNVLTITFADNGMADAIIKEAYHKGMLMPISAQEAKRLEKLEKENQAMDKSKTPTAYKTPNPLDMDKVKNPKLIPVAPAA